MPPFHIQDELDYVNWVEAEVARGGGYFRTGFNYMLLEVAPDEYAGIIIEKHVVPFGDGTSLSFRLHISEGDLLADHYSYDYRQDDGQLIWRKDCHKGHEDVGLNHIHLRDREEFPDKYDEVEIDEVIHEILEYQDERTAYQ